MARSTSKYVCQQCGYGQVGWAGKCPECGSWGSLVETVSVSRSPSQQRKTRLREGSGEARPIPLASVPRKNTARISTKISELDRALGGGIVPGQVILMAGEPGIGKSTILLQLADKLASSRQSQVSGKKAKARDQKPESTVLYVSGEESANQIKLRADRLGVGGKSIQVMEETDIDQVINQISSSNNSKAVIVDSIQTMRTSDLSGMAGSVGQVRECAYRLVRLAKSTNTPIFIVGHVTKQGSVAGPAVLAHLVDTVLWFEGDKSKTLRMLRAMKNRFGPTDEVGIFSMEDKGLISITDSSKLFLSGIRKSMPGSVVSSVMKGTRPILIEIQSLIVPTKLAFPRRIAQGIDSKRLEMLLAVLTRRCGLRLYDFDCFVNVTGGITLRNDPSADLAICLSIASSYYDKSIPKSTIAIGEVGLLGDIREVIAEEKRAKEAKRLGFKNPITQKQCKYLGQAIKVFLK